jgi:FemAB-related protein (PEP-CTERM system-associated)
MPASVIDAPRGIPVSIARAADAPAVAAFVDAHPLATAYHDPAFARVVRRGGGVAVATFLARERGEVRGVLPLALTRSLLFGTYATSLPFVNYGGVLAAEPDAARALVAAGWAWARSRGARHMVLRHTADRPLDLPATRGKETLTLALASERPEDAWARIGSKTRNLVRKAERAGLSARAAGPEALRAFHAIYAEKMRDLGSPMLGEAFFRVLFEEVGARAEVHVVRHGERAAAAAIAVRFRDRLEVPWAACRERYNPLAANMLLYWHLIAHAARMGARLFDFGRSTPGTGPYRFKLQWGARPEPLPWYYVGGTPGGATPTRDLSPENPRFALAIRLWQRLPVGLARVLGARLAPALP